MKHRHAIARALILVVAGLCGLTALVTEHGLRTPVLATRVLDAVAVVGFLVELGLAWRWRSGTRSFLRARWLSLVLTVLLVVQVVLVFAMGSRLLAHGGSWWRPTSLTQMYLVVAQFYVVGVLFAHLPRLHRRFAQLRMRPGVAFVLVFAVVILVGASMLLLPRATPDDVDLSPLDALFTATSAVCVTGLIVRDTATEFTRFGQVLILVLIQLGGLGIMSLSATMVLMLGRGISLRESQFMREVFQVPVLDGVSSVLRFIVLWTLASEAAGAILLYDQLDVLIRDPGERLFTAIFHAVSAFCNAGFSTYSDSLMSWSATGGALWTVALLLVTGGLGFTVMLELLRRLRAFGQGTARSQQPRLGLQTRVVTAWTAGLLVAGAAGLALLEWNGALAGLPWPRRLAQALFQSATCRTAGFNSLDLNLLGPASLFLMVVLMFIGAGSGSTAGGVKINTVAVITSEIRAIAAGRRQLRLRNREIDEVTARRATVVLTVSAMVGALGIFALLILEPLPPLSLVFEAVSALGTVGLSLGVTPQLSVGGKLVIIVLMFVGRLGVLTLAYALARQAREDSVRMPNGRLMIG
ncbi:MAG: potassium transporter TrkG [Candidatus Krumholzibacteriia bacterium]